MKGSVTIIGFDISPIEKAINANMYLLLLR